MLCVSVSVSIPYCKASHLSCLMQVLSKVYRVLTAPNLCSGTDQVICNGF